MAAQANPNSVVLNTVSNIFWEQLKAGLYPKVEFKHKEGRGTSYDNTEYNKHFTSYMRLVDAELKKLGFAHGIHTKNPGVAYQQTVAKATREIDPQAVIAGTQRGPVNVSTSIPVSEAVEAS